MRRKCSGHPEIRDGNGRGVLKAPAMLQSASYRSSIFPRGSGLALRS